MERAYRIRPRTFIDFALVLGGADIARALRICRGPIGRGSGGNATRAGPSVVAPGRWKSGLAAFQFARQAAAAHTRQQCASPAVSFERPRGICGHAGSHRHAKEPLPLMRLARGAPECGEVACGDGCWRAGSFSRTIAGERHRHAHHLVQRTGENGQCRQIAPSGLRAMRRCLSPLRVPSAVSGSVYLLRSPIRQPSRQVCRLPR